MGIDGIATHPLKRHCNLESVGIYEPCKRWGKWLGGDSEKLVSSFHIQK